MSWPFEHHAVGHVRLERSGCHATQPILTGDGNGKAGRHVQPYCYSAKHPFFVASGLTASAHRLADVVHPFGIYHDVSTVRLC